MRNFFFVSPYGCEMTQGESLDGDVRDPFSIGPSGRVDGIGSGGVVRVGSGGVVVKRLSCHTVGECPSGKAACCVLPEVHFGACLDEHGHLIGWRSAPFNW